jgi:prolyl oligopeptidase
VPPWQVAKFAARLEASTSSGKPILLRLDYPRGHLVGAKAETETLLADEWNFLLWQFGDPTFSLNS